MVQNIKHFSGKGESPLRGLSDRKVECGRDS